jgi:hypothetical protein
MSSRPGKGRLILASLLAIPLALLSGAHALSSASLRNAPELALAVYPFNGLAKEKVAYNALVANISDAAGTTGPASRDPDPSGGESTLRSRIGEADLARLASAAADPAREAIRREPLSARAFVILSLSEQNPQQKDLIVRQASRLTRRDIALQALVLEQKGKVRDYPGVIGTLDEILRVHPQRQGEFFPLLVEALRTKATVPEFATLLARPLPWKDSFLNFALADEQALENLAAVRERMATANEDFDRKIVAKLASSGQIESAERIYRRLGGAAVSGAKPARFSWQSTYPPFDWQLADQPGFRARIGDTPSVLEIDVEPGNGGVIASRLVSNPQRQFTLRLAHDIQPASQLKDMKLTIACHGQAAPFLERAFVAGETSVSVDQPPACEYLDIAITARAWTDSRALAGTLSPLRISSAAPQPK